MIFEVSKDQKIIDYPAWMEIRRIKRLSPLSLHYQGYKPKNYWLLNLWNLTLHQNIRMWKHSWVLWQKDSSWMVTPCGCHGYCFLCCASNCTGMRLVEFQVLGFFFPKPASLLHSPADAKPMLEGGKANFHSFIDLSDKNLINLLYKLLKQSKRNELTWYIQHWLLLSKKGMSALSATTAAIQFLRNKFFPSLAPQK